jgi:translation elongation factor EF-1beta
VLFLGKMIVIYRINPKEQENAEETMKELKTMTKGEFKDAQLDSPGFGIKIVKSAFLLANEKEDEVELLTQEINALESVEDAEVEGMTLL